LTPAYAIVLTPAYAIVTRRTSWVGVTARRRPTLLIGPGRAHRTQPLSLRACVTCPSRPFNDLLPPTSMAEAALARRHPGPPCPAGPGAIPSSMPPATATGGRVAGCRSAPRAKSGVVLVVELQVGEEARGGHRNHLPGAAPRSRPCRRGPPGSHTGQPYRDWHATGTEACAGAATRRCRAGPAGGARRFAWTRDARTTGVGCSTHGVRRRTVCLHAVYLLCVGVHRVRRRTVHLHTVCTHT
jgi:hypothetical protein